MVRSPAQEALLEALELHSPERIRQALAAGADPLEPIDGSAPVVWLQELYSRSPRLAACLRVLLEAGARLDDACLRAVLLDDADELRALVRADPGELDRRFHLRGAYTTLEGVRALHLCAEYASAACARVLLEAGAPVDARADVDADGLGGQTALFHAVNSNRNHARPVMELLVEAGAGLELRVDGLVWGAGHPWETVLYDQTPISFAQCGLLPQFHRDERAVYSNLEYLLARRHGRALPARNVPNAYVAAGIDLAAARAAQTPPAR